MNKKFFLLLAVFLLVQIPIFFTALPADENVYYAIAKEVSEGSKLYTDIFFSHPPLQIWIYVGLIKLFGFHIWILKGLTLLVSLSIAIFVYLIAKERYNEKIGLIATFLFLTSYDILIFGSFAFGLEIAVLFFLGSYYFLNKENLLSGVLFGFCIMTRLHLAPLGLILLLYSKERMRFLVGSSICLIYYGILIKIPLFLESILGYHMSKPFYWKGWISYFRTNIHLIALFLFSIKKIKNIDLVFIGFVYLLFMLLMKSVFEYYFLIITVIFCIEGANCLIYSDRKKMLRFIVALFIFLLLFKAVPFLYNQSKGYNELTNYVDTLEGDMVGQSAITSFLAIKTNKDISNHQIDTNFQRRAIYNYSNAIVVYFSGLFHGEDFNCTRLRTFEIEDKAYDVFKC